MSDPITLPSHISVYPDNLSSTVLKLELTFTSIDETLTFLESLFRLNPQSLINPDILQYLVQQLQPRTFDLIVKILETNPAKAGIFFKHLVYIDNKTKIHNELLYYILNKYAEHLSIPNQDFLVRIITNYGLNIIDILFEHKIMTPTDILLQQYLYQFIRSRNRYRPLRNASETEKYLIQKGVSLEYTFDELGMNRVGYSHVNNNLVLELLKIPPPAGIDPNLHIRLDNRSSTTPIPVWCLAVLLNDYSTFEMLIDRGANIWETDSDGFILVRMWNELTLDRTAEGIMNPTFFEYFSKVGFNLNLYDTTFPNSYVLKDLADVIAEDEFVLEQWNEDVIQRLEEYYEGLINSGLDPINRETVIIGDGAFDDIIFRNIMEYLKSYPYSLVNLSIFSMNKHGIPTGPLPEVLRQGNATFDLIEVINDNMDVYRERWDNP